MMNSFRQDSAILLTIKNRFIVEKFIKKKNGDHENIQANEKNRYRIVYPFHFYIMQ